MTPIDDRTPIRAPIIFLDLDGTLNRIGGGGHPRPPRLEPSCVAALNRVVATTGAEVVLSSSWRALVHDGLMTVAGLGIHLRSHGVDCRLVDVTPEGRRTRAGQVRDWLDRRGAGIRFVVLDDADDGFTAAGMPFVRTEGDVGLTEADADRAIALLGGAPGPGVPRGCDVKST